ncbi:hypothetical protein [Pseudomonas sp. ML96]|uniref:hypothetical protein n=1 Tax=Pseudomonas sp. ML96 TaxID=1523503 RepID=UPI0005BB2EE0|nr:hypothetical protein [Pseudomonas sp. ML96]
MQPARQDLPVVPGTTYRDTVRLMQPDFAYKQIAGISGAPAQVTAPDHGLAGDWPVWVRNVTGLPTINREPDKALPHRAQRVDADTLEINTVSAVGTQPQGGQLVYKLPVDLTGAVVRMRFSGLAGDDLVLTLGAGLANPAPGTVTRALTKEQTEQLVGDWAYTFEVEFASGDLVRYFEGGQAKPGGCHG